MGHTVVVLRVYGTKGTAQLLHNVMIVMIERAINNCTVYYIQSSPPPRPLPPPPPHTAPPSPENGAIGGGEGVDFTIAHTHPNRCWIAG